MHVFMTLFGPLETDARVLRSIEAVLKKGYSLSIITYHTADSFSSYGRYELVNISKTINNRYIAQLYFTLFACLFYFRKRKIIDLIYLQDYFSITPGLLLSCFVRKKRIIYDAHELLISPTRFKKDFKTRYYIRTEKKLITKENVLVVEANRERERIMQIHYKLKNTINVLNISKFTNIQEERSLPGGDIYVVYQGAMSAERNIPFFIEALKYLPSYIKLMLIGDGPILPLCRDIVEKEELLDRVVITGRLSNKDMMEKLKQCSVGIISYSFLDWNNIYCSPNKIFEYAAISLPFISTDQPFIKEIAKKYGIGLTFKHDNLNSFVDNLMKLTSDYPKYTLGMKRFLTDYSYDKEMQKLSEVL